MYFFFAEAVDFVAGLKRWYDLADGRITTEKEDYEADRL